MEKFVWNEAQFGIGHKQIDQQHRKLMEMVNTLIELSRETRVDEAQYLLTLIELDEYIHQHFSTEEQLMKMVNYPDLAAHQAQHIALSDRASELIVRHDINQLNQAVTFLKQWLNQHILIEDQKLKNYL